MTLTIGLPDEQTLVLQSEGKRAGCIRPSSTSRQVLEQNFVPDCLLESWESSAETGVNQLLMDEIDAEIGAQGRPARKPAANRFMIRTVLDRRHRLGVLKPSLGRHVVFVDIADAAVREAVLRSAFQNGRLTV
jgi:hypothetical protein